MIGLKENANCELEEAINNNESADEARRKLNEVKSAFGGNTGDWLLSVIGREITRCEWERKNVYFVGEYKRKIKALKQIENFVRYIREE